MNKALTKEFLALVSHLYTKEFKTTHIGNPNMSFRDVFHTFLEHYGEADKNNHKLNKDRMEVDWHPNDGLQKLISNIADGIRYDHFADQPITDAEAIDIGIRVIMQCGLLPMTMNYGNKRMTCCELTSKFSGRTGKTQEEGHARGQPWL